MRHLPYALHVCYLESAAIDCGGNLRPLSSLKNKAVCFIPTVCPIDRYIQRIILHGTKVCVCTVGTAPKIRYYTRKRIEIHCCSAASAVRNIFIEYFWIFRGRECRREIWQGGAVPCDRLQRYILTRPVEYQNKVPRGKKEPGWSTGEAEPGSRLNAIARMPTLRSWLRRRPRQSRHRYR